MIFGAFSVHPRHQEFSKTYSCVPASLRKNGRRRHRTSQWSWWEDTTRHMDILGIATVWMVINQTTHHYPMIEISFVKYCSAKQTWIIVCFPSVNYYRPCQIGVGRLVSTKNELFSGFISDNLPEANILAIKNVVAHKISLITSKILYPMNIIY